MPHTEVACKNDNDKIVKSWKRTAWCRCFARPVVSSTKVAIAFCKGWDTMVLGMQKGQENLRLDYILLRPQLKIPRNSQQSNAKVGKG